MDGRANHEGAWDQGKGLSWGRVWEGERGPGGLST